MAGLQISLREFANRGWVFGRDQMISPKVLAVLRDRRACNRSHVQESTRCD